MDTPSLFTIASVPFFAIALLPKVLPWRRIRFRDIPIVVYIADVVLAPLMRFAAAGKITHWWDWTPIPRREIDPEIEPLAVESYRPQQRDAVRFTGGGRAGTGVVSGFLEIDDRR